MLVELMALPVQHPTAPNERLPVDLLLAVWGDLWNIVDGNEPRFVKQASPSTSDVTSIGSSCDAFVPPTQEMI